MASVLMRPPARRVLDAPALREAEVAALADDAGAQVAAVDADGVVGAVADLGVRLVGGLHERADAAVPEQVDGRAQDRRLQLGRRQRRAESSTPSAARTSGPSGTVLASSGTDAAAGGDLRAVVVVPRRAGQVEEPPALGEATRRVGVGIEEHVAVVERGDQPDLVGEQHAVAEHVARHVADADDGERLGGDVQAELAEVALDRLPGAPRGDAERLVVVAGRAARRERVAEPEAVRLRDGVGRVGERRRALVGGDHEVGVLAVQDAHAGRLDDLAGDEVVGDVEHARMSVEYWRTTSSRSSWRSAGGCLSTKPPLEPTGTITAFLTICAFIRPEDLGAVVLGAIRPADAAAGDAAAAQVDALHGRRVDEDLVQRVRLRHQRHGRRRELERQVRPVQERVGAHRRVDRAEVVAQDAVVVERGDGVERRDDLLAQRVLLAGHDRPGRIEPHLEVAHQQRRHVGMAREGGVLVLDRQLRADPLAVLAVRPQHGHLVPGQPGGDDQAVERVGLGLAVPDGRDAVGHALAADRRGRAAGRSRRARRSRAGRSRRRRR